MKRIITLCAIAAVFACTLLCGCDILPNTVPEQPADFSMSPKVDASALVNEGELRVGVDSSKAPFAGESAGKLVGVDVDLAAALADELGLKLKLVDISETGGAAALNAGTIDLFFAYDAYSAAKNPEIAICGTYLYDAAAVFSKNATYSTAPINVVSDGAMVAVQKSTTTAEEAYVHFGADSVLECETLMDAFNALESDQVQYAASSAVVGNYVAATQFEDAVMVGIMGDIRAIGIGIPAQNSVLIEAVDQGMKTLNSNGIASMLINRFLGSDLNLASPSVASDEKLASDAADAKTD